MQAIILGGLAGGSITGPSKGPVGPGGPPAANFETYVMSGNADAYDLAKRDGEPQLGAGRFGKALHDAGGLPVLPEAAAPDQIIAVVMPSTKASAGAQQSDRPIEAAADGVSEDPAHFLANLDSVAGLPRPVEFGSVSELAGQMIEAPAKGLNLANGPLPPDHGGTQIGVSIGLAPVAASAPLQSEPRVGNGSIVEPAKSEIAAQSLDTTHSTQALFAAGAGARTDQLAFPTAMAHVPQQVVAASSTDAEGNKPVAGPKDQRAPVAVVENPGTATIPDIAAGVASLNQPREGKDRVAPGDLAVPKGPAVAAQPVNTHRATVGSAPPNPPDIHVIAPPGDTVKDARSFPERDVKMAQRPGAIPPGQQHPNNTAVVETGLQSGQNAGTFGTPGRRPDGQALDLATSTAIARPSPEMPDFRPYAEIASDQSLKTATPHVAYAANPRLPVPPPFDPLRKAGVVPSELTEPAATLATATAPKADAQTTPQYGISGTANPATAINSSAGLPMGLPEPNDAPTDAIDKDILDFLPQTLRPTATSDAARPAPDARIPQRVAAQLAAVARAMPNGPVELALNPEELGRVRMTISASETSIAVSLSVERPETADLMRRNLDILGQEFRDLGYREISFTFSGHGSQERPFQNDRANTQSALAGDVADSSAPEAIQQGRNARIAGGMDLRF